MSAKRKSSSASNRRAIASSLPSDYPVVLAGIKSRIQTAQLRAAVSANRELVQLYWDIGRAITATQKTRGWGAKVIDRLANDIQKEFPGLAGFSRANVYRMRAFYLQYSHAASVVAQAVRQLTDGSPTRQSKRARIAIVPQLVRQPAALASSPPQAVLELPWGHNVILLEKVKDAQERLWYAQQTLTNGWSRSMLEHWIESDLYARQGKAIHNFAATLPTSQSDLARQVLKDPYTFDFLTLEADAAERDLEQGLMDHITRFLLELGEGFAFVGRQVHLEVANEDFYLDLLFYHLHLRCFVVVDLKTGPFKPEYTGNMNFYLSAVDDQMRKAGDAPSIGLILCKSHKKLIAEYALRHLRRPVGVARYITRLTARLPKALSDNR